MCYGAAWQCYEFLSFGVLECAMYLGVRIRKEVFDLGFVRLC